LDEAGRTNEAADEYRAVATTYSGPEPLVRLAMLLTRKGDDAEARAIASDVVKRGKLSPKFVRERHARWFAAASDLLNS
jgi:hypothetical protein